MKAIKRATALLVVIMLVMSVVSIQVLAINEKFEGYCVGDASNSGKTYSQYVEEHSRENKYKNKLTTSEDNATKDENGNPVEVFTGTYLKSPNTPSMLISVVDSDIKRARDDTNLNSITNDLNIQADIGSATDALRGFAPALNLFLGALCVLITSLLAVYTAFDVLYITFPAFQNKCNDAKASGMSEGVGTAVKTNQKTGETELKWVSEEAQYCVAATQTEQTGKNPLVMYLTKRIVSYIAVTIVLFILLTGNINIITNLALRIVGYIVDVLAGL